MTKWETEVFWGDKSLRFSIRRNSVEVGVMEGTFRETSSGLKYFAPGWFGIDSRFQKEYMETHDQVKMGEAISWGVLRVLKKKDISHIRLFTSASAHGLRFIERSVGTGIIEEAPEGLLRIKWEMVPVSEKALRELVGKMRPNEAKAKADARAAKIKRAREWAKRLFRRTRSR